VDPVTIGVAVQVEGNKVQTVIGMHFTTRAGFLYGFFCCTLTHGAEDSVLHFG
jgi:hypothetical protein